MNKWISILVVLILLTSASLDTFAYDDQDVSLDNSYAEEYSYEIIGVAASVKFQLVQNADKY